MYVKCYQASWLEKRQQYVDQKSPKIKPFPYMNKFMKGRIYLSPCQLSRFWATIVYEFNNRTYSRFIVEIVTGSLPFCLSKSSKSASVLSMFKTTVPTVRFLSIRRLLRKTRTAFVHIVALNLLHSQETRETS